MRARQMNSRLEALGDDRRLRRRVPLRGLKVHENRAKTLCQRVMDIARDAVTLLEHRLATSLEQTLLAHAAVEERESGLSRRRVEHGAEPEAFARRSLRTRDGDPA